MKLFIKSIAVIAVLSGAINSYSQSTEKRMKVKKIHVNQVEAAALPALLDREEVAFQSIETVNWAAYPYKPEVKFRIAHTDEAFLLHFRVKEGSVRARYGKDNGNVWTDACVEFFSIPAGDGVYYNIECNCVGTILIGAGSGRTNREQAPQEVMNRVQRWSSLGREPFEERIGTTEWEVALVIPYTTFYKHQLTSLDGKSIRANFYKCGDELQTPHFLSWSPIRLPKPNFHCPEFFGTLEME